MCQIKLDTQYHSNIYISTEHILFKVHSIVTLAKKKLLQLLQGCACDCCETKYCRCGCQRGNNYFANGRLVCCPCGCQCGICTVNECNHCCPCNCECGREVRNNRYVCKEECSNPNDCFPSTAMIKLEGGKSVTMSELMIGDRIQTGNAVSKLM